jgi:hypothetical protein
VWNLWLQVLGRNQLVVPRRWLNVPKKICAFSGLESDFLKLAKFDRLQLRSGDGARGQCRWICWNSAHVECLNGLFLLISIALSNFIGLV